MGEGTPTEGVRPKDPQASLDPARTIFHDSAES
jgi:hypothetical protein